MSYDLYLRPRSGPYDASALEDYFRARENYQVSERQAFYENDDTGVYFSLDLRRPCDDEEPSPDYPLVFSLNYYRPSFFLLEVEAEVSRLVETFDLVVNDPQMRGRGKGITTG